MIASCLSCNPVGYLYNGICISDCPKPHHVNNFTDFVCHEISQTQFLKVKIQSLGYEYAVPKDKSMYLKVHIDNTGGDSISSIEWSQLEPDVLLDPTLNVLSQDQDGTHNYEDQIVKISSNALLKIPSNQVVKVMCRVNNTKGETQYDIYEFYLNDSPFSGNITVSFVGEKFNSAGTTMDSLMHVKLDGWYDSTDDTEQTLKLNVYGILYQQIGIINYVT